ncbi:MAG: hypothetical protein ACOCP4_05770 [Candidatus Woesearchaeota archaeon]
MAKKLFQDVLTKEEANKYLSILQSSKSNSLGDDDFRKIIHYLIHFGRYREASNYLLHTYADDNVNLPLWYYAYYLIVFVRKDYSNPIEHEEDFLKLITRFLEKAGDLTQISNVLYAVLTDVYNYSKNTEDSNKKKACLNLFLKTANLTKVKNNDLSDLIYESFIQPFQKNNQEISHDFQQSIKKLISNLPQFDEKLQKNSQLEKYTIDETTEIETIKEEIERLEALLKHKENRETDNLNTTQYDYSDLQVLILGSAHVNDNVILGVLEDEGFNKKNIELQTDYKKLTNFNIKNLQYSEKYAFILIGAIPHKIKNLGKYSSVIELLNNEEGFPLFVNLETYSKGKNLKITKSSLRKGIKEAKSRLIAVQ